jgi:hypothetical protein
MMGVFPKFRIIEIQEGDEVALLGSITTTEYGNQTWIKDGWSGCLVLEGMAIYGNWRAHGKQWTFIPENRQTLDLFKRGAQWEVIDGYWGERAEIVLDMSRQWRKVRFEPSDAAEFRGAKDRWWTKAPGPKPGEGELIKGGWDHEHCAIQWETIDERQPVAYFSEPDTWVCEDCFNKFVLPRSLSFIPEAKTTT